MKKKWLSVLLSFIFPGAGHLYLGLVLKGILVLALSLMISLSAQILSPVFNIVYIIIWIYGIADSVRQTNKVNNIESNITSQF